MQVTREIAKKVLETVDAGLCSGVGRPVPGQMCVEAAVCYAMGLPHGDEPTCVSPALRSLKINLNDADWSTNMARADGLRELAILQLGSKEELDDVAFAKELVIMTTRVMLPIALRAAAKLHKNKKHKTALEKHAVSCEQAHDIPSSKAASEAASLAASRASLAASRASLAARAASLAASRASLAASRASEAASWAESEASEASEAASRASLAASRASEAASWAESEASEASEASKKEKDKTLKLFAKETASILIRMDVPGVKWLTLIKE